MSKRAEVAIWLASAAAVFAVASIVQAAGGSSMFSTTYPDRGFFMSLLMNATFWPGWLGMALCVIFAAQRLFSEDSEESADSGEES